MAQRFPDARGDRKIAKKNESVLNKTASFSYLCVELRCFTKMTSSMKWRTLAIIVRKLSMAAVTAHKRFNWKNVQTREVLHLHSAKFRRISFLHALFRWDNGPRLFLERSVAVNGLKLLPKGSRQSSKAWRNVAGIGNTFRGLLIRFAGTDNWSIDFIYLFHKKDA